jgi:hypothetical protein
MSHSNKSPGHLCRPISVNKCRQLFASNQPHAGLQPLTAAHTVNNCQGGLHHTSVLKVRGTPTQMHPLLVCLQDLIITSPTLSAPFAVIMVTSTDPTHSLDSPAFMQRCAAAPAAQNTRQQCCSLHYCLTSATCACAPTENMLHAYCQDFLLWITGWADKYASAVQHCANNGTPWDTVVLQ